MAPKQYKPGDVPEWFTRHTIRLADAQNVPPAVLLSCLAMTRGGAFVCMVAHVAERLAASKTQSVQDALDLAKVAIDREWFLADGASKVNPPAASAVALLALKVNGRWSLEIFAELGEAWPSSVKEPQTMTAHARAPALSSPRVVVSEPSSFWTAAKIDAITPTERLSNLPLPHGLPSAHAHDGLALKMLKHVFNPGEGWHAALPGGLAVWSQDWNTLRIAGVLGAGVTEDQALAVLDRSATATAIVARRIEDWRWAAYAAVLQAQDAGGARVKRANDKRNTVYVGDNGVIVVLTLGQVQRLVTCWREPKYAGTRSSPRDENEARRYRTSSRPRIADLMKPEPFAGLRSLVPDEELSPEPATTDDTQDPGENL